MMETMDKKKTDFGETDFGFEAVSPEEKTRRVQGVFDSVASRYDLMNDLMSGGLHRLWKEAFIDRLRPTSGMRVVDVAGGTGDIAFRILKRSPDARVTICDLTADMLRVGRDRAIDQTLLTGLDWTCGNAEALPFPDASMDAYTIAFGLRNVTDKPKALAEARRVLKPGGHFLCLEFSRVSVPFLDRLYDRYSFSILPWMGQLVARDRASYQYLAESIRQFPPQETLAAMLEDAGLGHVSWQNMSGGIVAMHSAWRI